MEKKWHDINYYLKATDLKDALNMSDDEVIKYIFTLYVDYETLINNFDNFLRILKVMMSEGFNTINVEDYRCVKFINDNLKEPLDIIINILDDFDNRPRNEIKKAEIDKVSFSVPLPYLLWGVDFDNLMYVTMVQSQNNALSYNGNKTISLDSLKRIKEIIEYLKSKGHFTDLQIIILVANYLQRSVEYIIGNKFMDSQAIYTLDNPVLGIEEDIGLVESVLFKRFGVCTGIANATTLLLNNPTFNIDARTLANKNHAFNIVKLNGEYYFLDNTWGITRSSKEFEKAIKPISFNSDYLLYGKKSFDFYHRESIELCSNPNIDCVQERSYRKDKIDKAIKQMSSKVSFTYPEDIVLPLTKRRL